MKVKCGSKVGKTHCKNTPYNWKNRVSEVNYPKALSSIWVKQQSSYMFHSLGVLVNRWTWRHGTGLRAGWPVLGEGSSPITLVWHSGCIWGTVSSSGLPSTRKTRNYQSRFSRGLQKMIRGWNIFLMKTWGSWSCLAWRKKTERGSYQCIQMLMLIARPFSGAQGQDKGQRAQTKT